MNRVTAIRSYARAPKRAATGRTSVPEALFVGRVATPIGPMVIVVDNDDRVRAADWPEYDARMRRLLRLHCGPEGVGHALAERSPPRPLVRTIEAYFAGEMAAVDALRVKTCGTLFQERVWAALREIPAGTTTSYGALAVRIGRPNAVRAVGMANGANPVGLVVPCHRVVGADGSLTGYGGGIDRKRWLLAHEGARGWRAGE